MGIDLKGLTAEKLKVGFFDQKEVVATTSTGQDIKFTILGINRSQTNARWWWIKATTENPFEEVEINCLADDPSRAFFDYVKRRRGSDAYSPGNH